MSHIVTQVFGRQHDVPVENTCFPRLSGKNQCKSNHLDVLVWPLEYRDLRKLG